MCVRIGRAALTTKPLSPLCQNNTTQPFLPKLRATNSPDNGQPVAAVSPEKCNKAREEAGQVPAASRDRAELGYVGSYDGGGSGWWQSFAGVAAADGLGDGSKHCKLKCRAGSDVAHRRGMKEGQGSRGRR